MKVMCIKTVDTKRVIIGNVYKMRGPSGLFIVEDENGKFCSFGNDPVFWEHFITLREYNLNILDDSKDKNNLLNDKK